MQEHPKHPPSRPARAASPAAAGAVANSAAVEASQDQAAQSLWASLRSFFTTAEDRALGSRQPPSRPPPGTCSDPGGPAPSAADAPASSSSSAAAALADAGAHSAAGPSRASRAGVEAAAAASTSASAAAAAVAPGAAAMSPPHLTQPGHRIPGAPDCTIVLDPAALAHAGVKPPRKHGAVADSARDIADVADSAGTSSIGGSSRQSSAMQLHHDKLEKSSVEAAADDTNGSSGHLALGVDASASVRRAPRLRTYYVDWLRAFLTVLVVCHHCITCYQSSYAWAAKKGDTALWLLASLFVGANQAYFMTLFFFLSGLYVPGSYRRKGAWQFMQDRTLRLVLPCIVYSLLAPPFILMWNEMAKNPSANVAAAWGSAYRSWLKPGWPSTYVLPTGPPWFVWMLWCFNVAYVVLQLLIRVLPKSWTARPRPRTESTTALNELPEQWAAQQKAQQAWAKAPLTSRATLGYAAALTGVLAVSCYGVRMLDMFVFEIRPSAFVARGPFVSFMPDYLPVYLAAFALGTFSGPSRWDLLARLPAHWGSWCLCVSGVWWLLAGWLLNVTLHSWMSMQRGVTAFVLTWALRTFVEQSFCVFWSIGLLVLFRQAYNVRPNWMGRQFINGAYGAYLVHLPLVYVFARALMHVPFPSAVVNAVAIAPMAVLAAWVLACLLRAIPYADRVL